MFLKLLSTRKYTPSIFRHKQVPAASSARSQKEDKAASGGCSGVGSSVVKIVHVGGLVEIHYMAVPARSIMRKYSSSFLLARPEIFKRPWDSIVHPDEILVPGERFFVVPDRTVKKLRKRVKKPAIGDVSIESSVSISSSSSGSSQSSVERSSKLKTDSSFIKVQSEKSEKVASCQNFKGSLRKKIPSKAGIWNPSLGIIYEGSQV